MSDYVSEVKIGNGVEVPIRDLTWEQRISNIEAKLATIESYAEVNKNSFNKVKVGSVQVAADTKEDVIELLAGSNMIITADAANDSVTFSSHQPQATSNAAGLMSATDKAKLDAVPNIIFGTYRYSSISTREVAIPDDRLLYKTYVIVSAQDAGNPPLRATIVEDNNATHAWLYVYLADPITVGRYNYVAW